jgi:hypothetical protein
MTDNIAMKAHPTTYAGVNFRSRLEAKWAAFFDRLQWTWEYEPVDLSGWTPDFAIAGHDGPIYVEVKPIEWFGSKDNNVAQVKARHDLKKVFTYGGLREVLIVGTAPPFVTITASPHEEYGLSLGVLQVIDRNYEDPSHPRVGIHHDPANLWASQDGGFDFAANYGSYQFRIGGQYDGDGHLREVDRRSAISIWREACNAVQWKGSK